MSQRSVVAGLGLMMVLGACGTYGPTNMYTTPGWYLEKPRFMMAAGPEIFAGPMTYDDCEAKRASSGVLALQLHAGPPMTAQFKNIRLKKL